LVVPAIRNLLDVVTAAVSRPSLGTLRGRGETRNGIPLPRSHLIVRMAGFCLLHDQVNEGRDPDIFARRSV
jgi:hypothetical protein